MNVGRGHRSLWLVGLCGAMFCVLTWNIVAGIGLAGFDDDVERVVVGHRVGWATAMMKTLTWLGSTVVLWPMVAIVALALVVRWKRWREAAFVLLALGGSVVLSDLVKAWVDRTRPPSSIRLIAVSGAAYPSGHSMDAMAAYGAIAVVVAVGQGRRGRWAIFGAAGLIILVVGWSRLYLGEHWLTDVLGGVLLGVAWVAGLFVLLRPPAGPARSERYQPDPGR